MKWHVLYVRSRAEKKVADRLLRKGVEVFCPLRTEVRQWSDRKKKVDVPYFRSYVFVRFKKKERTDVLQTPGVVGFVYWLRKPALIREKEMQEVIRFFEDHPSDKISCETFEVGESLQIQKGSFKDRKGVVVRQKKHKIVLQIEQLGVSLSVEIDKREVARK